MYISQRKQNHNNYIIIRFFFDIIKYSIIKYITNIIINIKSLNDIIKEVNKNVKRIFLKELDLKISKKSI